MIKHHCKPLTAMIDPLEKDGNFVQHIPLSIRMLLAIMLYFESLFPEKK